MLGRSSGNHDWLLTTQALAYLAVFVYATHATQAIAFEWKPGLTLTQYLSIVHRPLLYYKTLSLSGEVMDEKAAVYQSTAFTRGRLIVETPTNHYIYTTKTHKTHTPV